jgi:glycosyltransferase involved in cell wall biosynthesis
MAPQSLSIIIPAYNEESTILAVLDRVMNVAFPYPITREVIVVNDGSTDGTLGRVKAYSDKNLIRLLSFDKNAGKSRAVARGIAAATGNIVLIQDADLEYDPANFPDLLSPILSGQADVVYGSRFRGRIINMHPLNRLANVISNLTVNAIFSVDLTDINTCYKVFKREHITGIEIESRNFGFETEITAKLLKKGLKIVEVPISYTARTRSSGKKMTIPRAIEMYLALLKFR